MFLVAVVFYLTLRNKHRYVRQPFKAPMHSGALDYHERNPATRKPSKAKGIHYLGNDIGTGEELWATDADMRAHNLVLGTTGAGKTENLKGYVSNALSFGSGFLYVDGKADTDLYLAMSSICRRFGRDDDLLVVNFMKADKGKSNVVDPEDTGFTQDMSNTLNPLATGSGDAIRELMVSLMDDAGQGNGMWKGRAISLMGCISNALVYLRDNYGLLLDVSLFREYLALEKIQELELEEKLPVHIREQITAYLNGLPGYTAGEKKQKATTLEQHGFLQMQYTKLLSSLADSYGNIFKTQKADIDLEDVVLNRRCVVVLLPSLKVSPSELANLGKIVVANLKGMMGSTLGSAVEGKTKDIIYTKPTRASTPFYAIFDEVGYYFVEGMAVMAAQARSLGFSLIFGAQDLAQMRKLNKEEADSVIANTAFKVGMKVEDPGDTAELFVKSAGDILIDQTSGFQSDAGSFAGYRDQKSTSTQVKSRVHLLDLKSQGPGEAHFIFEDKLVRGRTMFVKYKDIEELSVARSLPVILPSPDVCHRIARDVTVKIDARKHVASSLINPKVPGRPSTYKQFRTLAFIYRDIGLVHLAASSAILSLQDKKKHPYIHSDNDVNTKPIGKSVQPLMEDLLGLQLETIDGDVVDDHDEKIVADLSTAAKLENDKSILEGVTITKMDIDEANGQQPQSKTQDIFNEAVNNPTSPCILFSDGELNSAFEEESGNNQKIMSIMEEEGKQKAPSLSSFAANVDALDWEAPVGIDDKFDETDFRYRSALESISNKEADQGSETGQFGAEIRNEYPNSLDDNLQNSCQNLLVNQLIAEDSPEYDGLLTIEMLAADINRETAQNILQGLVSTIRMSFRHPTKKEQAAILSKNKNTKKLAEMTRNMAMALLKKEQKNEDQ